MKKLSDLLSLLALLTSVLCSCAEEEPGDKVDDLEMSPAVAAVIEEINNNLIYVEGGTFMMGNNDYTTPEKPMHEVTLSSYYIGKYEVTQSQWTAIMGTTIQEQESNTGWGLYGVGDNYPMYYVSYDEAKQFCKKLTTLSGKTYRLPTEAEWEYAARGGNKAWGYKFSGGNTIDYVAWIGANSDNHSHEVGQKAANELGIYDMSGNVWEWCLDWYGKYPSESRYNPTGTADGTKRIVRGGGFGHDSYYCRVTFRDFYVPFGQHYWYGFRVVCEK